MFTLTDTPVKFVGLLVLFVFSTIWSVYQLGHRQTGPTLVSNLAHLAMSGVMLLMVSATLWQPLVLIIGLPVLVGFFGACVLWFVALGVRGFRSGQRRARTHGWHALGHAGMFGAMTWHLAAMLAHGGGGLDHSSHGMAMPAHHAGQSSMNHGPMDAAAITPAGVDPALAVAIIGVPFMAYLLAAAIWSLKNAVSPGADLLDHTGHELAGHGHYAAGSARLGALADFAMNFGMFWMSTGLLAALLPFIGVL